MKKTKHLSLTLLTLSPTLISCSSINSINLKIQKEDLEIHEELLFETEKLEKEKEENSNILNIFNSINEMNKQSYRFEEYFKCINLDEKECTIYKIYNNTKYEGYIIIDETLNIFSLYFGDFNPIINNDNKYIINSFSFVSYDEFLLALTEKKEKEMSTQKDAQTFVFEQKIISQRNLNIKKDFPCERSDLKKQDLSSHHFRELLTNVPEYYNYSYGPVMGGCAPTSGAMLLAYYDMYSNLTNLIDGDMPLNHVDNKQKVDDLIIKLASSSYMNTNFGNITNYHLEEKDKGTLPKNIVSGLTKYFKDRGYGNYVANSLQSVDYEDLLYFISIRSNPFLLRVVQNDDNGAHEVLCHGYSRIRYAGDFAITKFNHLSKSGDYYVPLSSLNSEFMVDKTKRRSNIIYISKK